MMNDATATMRGIEADDADDIREMRESPGYGLVQARIAGEVAKTQGQLEQPADENQTNFLRGKLSGLRIALGIPEILEDEAKDHAKSKSKTRP